MVGLYLKDSMYVSTVYYIKKLIMGNKAIVFMGL